MADHQIDWAIRQDAITRAVNAHDALLAACKRARDEIVEYHSEATGLGSGIDWGRTPAMKQIDAAIALAEGTTP